jgi:putative phosphoesterase
METKHALGIRSMARPFAIARLRGWFGETFDYDKVRDKRVELMSAHIAAHGIEAKKGADTLLLLGDTLYHGPRNDLPRDYAPKEVTAMLTGLELPVFGVRGNCDAEIDQTVLGFPIMADYSLFIAGRHKIFVTHGHLYTPEEHPRLNPGDAFLFGHIHVPVCEERDGILILNPGSVSIPKEDSPHIFMLYEGGVFRWLDLADGSCWQETPWEA